MKDKTQLDGTEIEEERDGTGLPVPFRVIICVHLNHLGILLREHVPKFEASGASSSQ